jgi:hypothetical protein
VHWVITVAEVFAGVTVVTPAHYVMDEMMKLFA